MEISTKYISLIGIFLFIAIISQTDISNIINIIQNTRIEYILLSYLAIPITILLKGIRWKKIIDMVGLKYKLTDSLKALMIGTFVGTLTPGQSGDLIRTLYLQDKNPSSKSLSTIIIDRLLDLFSLALLGFTGIIIISYWFQHTMYSLYLIIIIPMGLIAIITNKKLLKKISYFFLIRFIPTGNRIDNNQKKDTTKHKGNILHIAERKKTYIKECFNEFYNSLHTINQQKKQITCLLAITLTIWIIGAVQTYLVITALNINISFLYVLSFTPIIILVNLIPISISGIGTRDISMIYFFSLIGISATYAISASLLLLFILWTELSIGAVLWTLNPRKIKI